MTRRIAARSIATAAALSIFALHACTPEAPSEPKASRSTGVPTAPHCDTADIEIGGVPVTVEIADTAERRQFGLMFRPPLPDDRGMLFIFPEARTLSFWMRNCPNPLDIAYLNDAGQILKFERMDAFAEHGGYSSPGPVRLAIELSAGWFERHGVKPMAWAKMPVDLLTRRGGEDRYDLEQIPRILVPPGSAQPGH